MRRRGGPRARSAAALASWAALAVVAVAPSLGVLGQAPQTPGHDARVRALQADIVRLRRDLAAMEGRERGILGDLARLDQEHALRAAEHDEVTARLARTSAALEEGGARLQGIEAVRSARARSLAFRLREIYKRGPASPLRRLVAGEGTAALVRGLRYAVVASERDARQLLAFRRDGVRLAQQRRALEAERASLAGLEAELSGAAASLARSRERQGRFLAGLRGDRRRSEDALAELESAAQELGRIAAAGSGGPVLDIRKFRGLLDRPLAGRVIAPYGRTVDPRFGTAVPHPGLDIQAAPGTPFRAVFDGKVLWAGPLRGYGLTAIVDHGSGLASVYAHAAGLVVEKGETVLRGQTLGQVGDTGASRGAYLYFELREGGRPVDPAGWLLPP